jgi:hypothetical protein
MRGGFGMNNAMRIKHISLVLASALLLGMLLGGCSDSSSGNSGGGSSGGTVTQPSNNSTVPASEKNEVGIQIPSADTLGKNGELVQSAAITEADVLSNGFAVQQESVTIHPTAKCVSQITTSAYISASLLTAQADGTDEATDELGSYQSSAALSVVQGDLSDAVNDMLAMAVSNDDIIPVTLIYNYIPAYTSSSAAIWNAKPVPSLTTFTVENGSDYTGTPFCMTYTVASDKWTLNGNAWSLDDSSFAGQIINIIFSSKGAADVKAMSDAALADVADLVSEYGYSTSQLKLPSRTSTTLTALNGSWTITQIDYATATPAYRDVAIQNNVTYTSSDGTFVYADNKKVDLNDPSVLLIMTRTLRTWLPNGAAAQVDLLYVYKNGALYGVKAAAKRAADASFDTFVYDGGVDAFLVDESGNLVRSDDDSTISDYTKPAQVSGALRDDDAFPTSDVSVYSMYWAALIGKDSPSEADIIAYLRDSETSALQGLQNADAFLEKVESSSQ